LIAPAPNSEALPELRLKELQGELRTNVYRFLMRLRFVVAPVPLLLGALVAVTDDMTWRRAVLGFALGTALIASFVEDHRVRRREPPSLEPPLSVIAFLQSLVMLCSGGVASPVVLAMLLVAFVSSTMLERRVALRLVGAFIAVVWCAALLEQTRWLGPLVPKLFRPEPGWGPGWVFTLVLALVESLVFAVSLELGARIRVAFADLLSRVDQARVAALRVHAERADELTKLSGEIAHELKNPLASVKGLAALLAREAQGEAAENLAVLRGEVDRMQRILDEFLNFSRPVVPLTMETLDLAELTAEVCALHEGWCRTRGVALELSHRAPVSVVGDARKLKQVLVNLLQNALEVTPEGGTVRVRVASDPRGARVVIEDEGPGIDARIAARLFEAGVTTKPRGSGLGLVVARGLARQHGGDITLESPPGGGAVAVLSLACSPVSESHSDAESHTQPAVEGTP
jgi:signal transduction histidine kinase